VSYQLAVGCCKVVLQLGNKPPRPTQPGHPCVSRHNEYWQWSRSPLGKKRRVLHNSGPVSGLLAYWHSWLKALVAMGPAIWLTCVIC